jgi:aflatoxin B1 aldehyde reductase
MGSNQASAAISVIFGTNAFGKFDYVPGLVAPFDTVEKITPILDALQSSGVKQLDTARLYGMGFAEPLLTESGYIERDMAVSTKLYPTAFRAAVMPGATKYTHRPRTSAPAS